MNETKKALSDEEWRERRDARDAARQKKDDEEVVRMLEEAFGAKYEELVASHAPPAEIRTDLSQAVAQRADVGKSFPVTNASSLPMLIDPLGRYNALLAELRLHGDYRRVRDEYCRLSILLNLEGKIAPAYRPVPKTGNKRGHSVYLEIRRDQVVIDCHWLYAAKQLITARDAEVQPLFKIGQPFPFDVAWVFANKKWTGVHRANEALYLTVFQQCQLVTMRGKTVSARHDAALAGSISPGCRVPAKIATVRQSLHEWCGRDRRMIPHREDYEQLWLAQELLGADAPVRQIAELSALMAGRQPRADKTVRAKIEKMHRHIAGD